MRRCHQYEMEQSMFCPDLWVYHKKSEVRKRTDVGRSIEWVFSKVHENRDGKALGNSTQLRYSWFVDSGLRFNGLKI